MKQKFLLKTMLLLSALVVGSSSVWAEDPDVEYSFSTFTSAATVTLTPNDDITIKLQKNDGNNNPAWNGTNSEARVYAKGSMVITSKNYNIAKIVYTYVVNANNKGVSPTIDGVTGKEAAGTWNSSTKTWTGSATEVTFSTSGSAGNVGFKKVEITYEAAPEVTSLSVKTAPTKVLYEVGETLDMTGFVLDADGSDVTSGYTMTMGGAAIVNGATLSSAGKKTITVAYGGKEVTQNISVGAVTGIEVTTPPTKTDYDTGDTFDPTGMVVTASLSTGELSEPDTWTKAVTGYTVDPDGALSPSDDIIIISYAGEDDAIAITVTDVAVTGVSVKSSTTIEKDKTETLTPTFTPSNATNKTVTWLSDNTDVATVSAAGVVTAVAAGTANITVTTNDGGHEATCVVTVVNEKGSIDAPYSVADVIEMNPGASASKTDVYVIGFIAGCVNGSNGNLNPATPVNSNLALVDDPDDTSSYISVQLPSGDFRTTFNVVDHPEHTGVTKLLIKADIIKYCGIPGLKSIDEMTKVAEVVKITDASGYATWASDSPLDFTDKDIDAYIAITKGNGTGVTFTQVNKVPANTGLLIHYTGAKTEEIPVFDGTGAATVTSNKFVKGTGATVATDDGTNYNYILNKVEDVIGFYKANGKMVAKNRAYISILKSESAAIKEFISLDLEDAPDGISLTPALSEGEGAIYNVAGQRLSKMQKGINIVNGKKVLF